MKHLSRKIEGLCELLPSPLCSLFFHLYCLLPDGGTSTCSHSFSGLWNWCIHFSFFFMWWCEIKIILHVSLLLRAAFSLRKMFLRLLWSLECCRALGLTVVFVFCISDYDKLLPHLLLLKIWKTKAKPDPAIGEYRKVHRSKEQFLSSSVVIHGVVSVIFFFFPACWRGTGQNSFLSIGTAPDLTSPPEPFSQIYGNQASKFFKNLRTPVMRWTLWELISFLHRQMCRTRVTLVFQSIFETMHQIRQNKEK